MMSTFTNAHKVTTDANTLLCRAPSDTCTNFYLGVEVSQLTGLVFVNKPTRGATNAPVRYEDAELRKMSACNYLHYLANL